jgi:vacuolar-type H+-ATPase subunit D/Vma8
MLAGVVEVQVHLASIRIVKLPCFEVRNEQAPQTTVKKDEINAKPGVVDA